MTSGAVPFGTQLQKSEFVDAGVPLWGIRNVNASFAIPAFEFVTKQTADRLSQYSIVADDIVMTRKGTVGNCAVYPNGLPAGVMHSDLLRLRINPEIALPSFVAHQLHHDPWVSKQMKSMSSGAIMPGLNVGRLKGLTVIAPPRELQADFESSIGSLERLRDTSIASLGKLNELFASLQSRAFSGQL